MTRVGVLGGSFDPPHAGHLMIASEAMSRVGLDAVLFIPAGEQWMKQGQVIAPATHRLAMGRLAAASLQGSRVSDVEVTRPGPSYTVDTMRLLRNRYDADTEIFFILGEDALADLPQWSRPQELVALCTLIAMPREGGLDRPNLDALESAVPGLTKRLIILEQAPRLDLSSSKVRQMIADGESLRGAVPNAVVKYIEAHRLYVQGAAVTPPGS